MHLIFLFLAWITPAFIAGILGINGIWGTGSAFFEYLNPLPVADGVFHVPSFAVAAYVILSLGHWPKQRANLVPIIAIAVLLAAQTLQLDFEDLNAWLFTDYEPSRTPFRFDDNPLFLFIATDAFWVALYAMAVGYTRQLRFVLLLPLVPVIIIGLSAFYSQTVGPQFRYGFTSAYQNRGNEIVMIYTPNNYDEESFLEWLEGASSVTRPWDTPNAENTAVWFTHSMQTIKYTDTENKEVIIATICLYEEDLSITAHPGYFDCFEGRINFFDKLNQSFTGTNTGLGKEVDRWYSMARLCEGIVFPQASYTDIEIVTFCRGLIQKYPSLLQEINQQYGEDSDQSAFISTNAYLLGL